MRLRGRFALWFSVTALVPIVAAALVTREFLSRTYQDDFDQRETTAHVSIEREISQLRDAVGDRIGSISSKDDRFVGGLLIKLAIGGGELPPRDRRDLKKAARIKMTGLGLDLLVIVGLDGVVLAAPHNGPLVGEKNEIFDQRALALKGQAYFAIEDVLASSGKGDVTSHSLEKALVVEAARHAHDGAQRVTVAGAIIIRDSLVARQPGTDARVVDADGVVLIGPAGDWASVEDAVTRIPLAGPTGAPVAFIEVGLSDDELNTRLAAVTLYSGLIAAAAVVVCLLLGLLIGRRITRDLDQLVIGVQAAARGDLDHEVPVRTKDEIGALAVAVNAMMVDLKESKERLGMAERVAAWSEIARRLAHEIKNPLTPIQMSMETLRKTWKKKHPSFDEIFEESTATVLEEAGRLRRIVSEFSEFARMPKPQKRRLDINELVSSSTSLYRASVPLDLELGDVPEIEADRDSLSQVILNLLENARDAIGARPDESGNSSETGGRIRVKTVATRNGKAVALIVDDTGPGIPADVKEKLFTPYFTTKHATGGSGLGLAIVHRIVSDHDGNILATDSPLGGARFVVELPTADASADDLSASLTGQLGGRKHFR